MKKIVKRVQSLNERAAELTAAAGQIPQRVAEMREVMTATTGQLQSLKSEIQTNVADLVTSHGDDLGNALAEIASHAPVLAEAGFLLDGLDIELSPSQRVVVQLVRIGEAEPGEIEALVRKHEDCATLRAVLNAMIKARDVAASVRIDGLEYHQLLIGIGPVPIIRIGWRAAQTEPVGGSPGWQPSASKPLGQGSTFFGPPIAQASVFTPLDKGNQDDEEKAAVSRGPGPAKASPPPLPPPDTDPLARFKVMPDLRGSRKP